ncbi:MAG: hypothetical protein GX262_07550 [Clostridia bacterium]|nr:hypothetical protein [Clostridia bacterium]
MDKAKVLMTKYLQVLGGAAGKEIDNLRAKMAWSLAQDFFLAQPTMPESLKDLSTSLEKMLQQQFPFCSTFKLKEVPPDGITVAIEECALKEANMELLQQHNLDLCPMSPFFIFVFSRSLSQNACLVEMDLRTDSQGCTMHFSLSNHRSCKLD